MAEAVLFSVAKGITRKLGNLIGQEIGLLLGVKDDLEKLRETVSTIQSVLLDAEERQVESHAVRDWLRKLSDVVHEADDLLDDFSTEALRREVMTNNDKAKKVCIFFSKSNQLAFGLELAHKIKAIREKLDAISADRIQFHFVEHTVRYRTREQTHSFVVEEEVIGREDDKKEIIQLLLDSKNKEDVSILPIVGIGGLGKTTLAQLVFNDEKIKKHFEKTMWVCVSDKFDVEMIVKKILESIEKNENSENPAKEKNKQKKLNKNTLVKKLKKEIDAKKYLLVLDDVWNDNRGKWLSLKTLLIGGARGSRILVTTRIKGVAEITKTIQPFFLKGLGKHESWSLFQQMAFERGQEPNNSKIVAIGKEIVEKCVGNPLAIRTIGRLLYLKKSEREWVSFKKTELSKIPQDENDILPTLKLSYDHLPSHLKSCFSYCSLFPKDYEIDITQLINLWIAQGFIQLDNHNQCLEDVGHDYFMDLVWRSFFQEVNQDEWGNVKKCKMHDLIHDLAILVEGKESTTLNSNAGNIDKKTCHVSFGFELNSQTKIPSPLFKASKIRTFLLPCQPQLFGLESKLNESIFDRIVSNFQFLRLLDMHRTGIHIVPSSIDKLKHLRYLDLSYNKHIKILPDSITKLHNLQTLKLSWCNNLKALPKDIHKLINLRHLENDGCGTLTHMPHGLGKLTNLQTLGLFMVRKISIFRRKGGLQQLYRLNNLRGQLEIGNLGHGKSVSLESKDANLKEKEHLQALELSWRDEHINDADVGYDERSLEDFQPHPNLKKLSIFDYSGMTFPSWLPLLSNLIEFSLNGCNKCQHLPPLDQLPSLKILRLEFLYDLEYISLSEENGRSEELSVSSFFPSLELLKIRHCYNLKGWKRKWNSVEEHHLPVLPSFPHLSSLFIEFCPKLTSMPPFPYLKEQLSLNNASIKPLLQTMTAKNQTSTTTITSAPSTSSSSIIVASSFTPLSNLKSLIIRRIEELKSLPADLSNDGDGMQWQGLKSLRTLVFHELPKLVSLPVGFQHVTTLQKLKILDCDSLMAIPEWIGNLTSLQQLQIHKCPNLTSLPPGMCALTSLQSLKIMGCPVLSQRCKRGIGEDWPKISHIPKLEGDLSCSEEHSEPVHKTWISMKTLGCYNCLTN